MTTTLEPTAIDTPADLAERRSRPLLTRFVLAFVLGLLAFLVLGAGALYAYDQQYQGRILPGVRVGEVDLSGLTADEAAARLHAAYDGLADGSIVLNAGEAQLTFPFSSAGRGPNVDAMVGQALSVGRSGNGIERAIANVRAGVRGVTIEPQVTVDQERLTHLITTEVAIQRVGPIDARIARTGAGYTVTPSIDGREADATAALATLLDTLGRFDVPSRIEVDLPFRTLQPTVTTTEARAAVDAANRIATDIRIVHGDDSWTISAAAIRGLITFQPSAEGVTPTVNASGLDPILKTLAKQVNRSPKDAALRMVDGRIIVTGSSQQGRTLNPISMKTAIMSELAVRQAGGAASPVAAVVTAVEPKLSTAAAKAFAPKMRMISSYRVYYFVIINNHWGGNIEAPATKINNTVVPAGGIFDFWKVVGDLRKLPGTGPGNAIEGGKITVTGAFGGGICTTSTTLFNAAFRAGMVPLARKNHNEFINRYPPGLDATVWIVGSTVQTMSFKNDTEYPILITRTVTNDGNRRWLAFQIWSVPNGRTAKVTNTVIQPGPRAIETVVRDATKPVGYVFRNNAPADGAKVWVTVSIYDHGKLHWSKRYFSNYPAVNGVTIIGTKAT